MVGHIPLEDGILVRVQVPQPIQNLVRYQKNFREPSVARRKVEWGEFRFFDFVKRRSSRRFFGDTIFWRGGRNN